MVASRLAVSFLAALFAALPVRVWSQPAVENHLFRQADGLRAWRKSPDPWTTVSWAPAGAPADPEGSVRLDNAHAPSEEGISSLSQCLPHVVGDATYNLAVLWSAPAGQALNSEGGYVYSALRFFSGPVCEPYSELGMRSSGLHAFGPEGSAGWLVATTDPTIAPSNTKSMRIELAHGRRPSQPGALSSVYFDVPFLVTGVSSFVKGSFDASGETGVLLRNTVTGEHAAWYMQDEGRTDGASITPVVPVAWQGAGVDDFNGDGLNDLLLWHPAQGLVDFWMLNGVTRVGGSIPISPADPGPAWKPSATADFDHDGKPDIVLRAPVSQQIRIWTMNGTTHSGDIVPAPSQAVDANWEIVGASDLDGDGNTDFLWYNATTGRIVYWLMDAAVVRRTGAFTNPPAAGDNNWKVLAIGDYGIGPDQTGQGVPGSQDLVWRNATSGKLVIWYMDKAGNRTAGVFTRPDQLPAPVSDWTIAGPR